MARSECSNILEMLSWILVIKLFLMWVGKRIKEKRKKREKERKKNKIDSHIQPCTLKLGAQTLSLKP